MASPSRYAQVARTYVHRWPLWLIAVAMGGYFCVLYGNPLTITLKSQRLMLLAALMWITAWASGTVAAHVKQQFTDASAALVPGYRTPHLLIGAIAMLFVAVIVPAMATPALAFSTAAVVGMALVVASSTAWFLQVQNFTAGIACNVLWLSLLNRGVMFALGGMLEGKNDMLAAVLIALGLVAFIALWMRLARLHEGMPEYGRRSLAVALIGPGIPAVQSTDTWFGSMLRRPVHTRCIAAANLWNRVRHLRATGLGRIPWLMAALLAASMVTVPLLSNDRPADGALEGFVIVLLIVPPMVAFTHWARRWPSLGYESLRPASRSAFIREIGLAMALDLVEAWVVVTTASIVPLLVWSPTLLADLAQRGFFLISAAMAVVVFGINVWILRFRNALLTALTAAITVLAPILPLIGHSWFSGNESAFVMRTLALLTIGAVITLDAYGRWCRADLE